MTSPEGVLLRGYVDIRSIFSPIESDLGKVEVLLKEYSKTDFEPLAQVLETTISSGGKRLRPALVLLSGRMFPQHDPHLYRLATAVELLHDATLIHDDLIDKSLVRRGAPTISSRWSEKATVLAGDYLLAKTARLSAEVGNFEVMRIIADVVGVICEGEIRQDLYVGALSIDRTEYYERIYAKTASLFAACTETAAVLGGAPEAARQALRDYGYNLGMAFQIADDVLDFVGAEREVGKPVGGDLQQGIATLPTIYFYEQDARRDVLDRLTFDNGHSSPEIEQAVEMIRVSPAIGAARAEAHGYADKARQSLLIFPDSPSRSSLDALARYAVERTK